MHYVLVLLNRYVSGLSKEVLYEFLGQAVAKLETVKLVVKKNLLGLRLIAALWTTRVRFPVGANIDSLQFCNTLVWKDLHYLI